MSTLSQPPEAGSTINAYCDCRKGPTTWTIKVVTHVGNPRVEYFYWSCLNCGKLREIGYCAKK